MGLDAPDDGCVPSTCAALNAQCGQLEDGCGGTLVCGDCPDGESCDPLGQCGSCLDNATDEQLCLESQAQCGAITITNVCGASRTVDCGVCSGTGSCGGAGVPNVCGEDQGDSCTTRYDCPDGSICKSGRCHAATDTCQQDIECPRGQICNFSGQCEAGCLEGRDCDSPYLCHPRNFVCEACSLDNPCEAGLSCLEGECRTATACTTTQDCVNSGADGTVCRDGKCERCENHADCAVAPYAEEARVCSVDGLCRDLGCDVQTCRNQLGSLAYCDTETSECATHECLSDADCTQSSTVCNLEDYTCVADNPSCDTATCQSECSAAGLSCDVAACRCAGAPGGPGDACTVTADCADDYVCGNGVCAEEMVTPTGEPCDANTCFLAECVGAITGRACDQTACYLALFLGVSTWCE